MDISGLNVYHDPKLAQVITVAEACFLWHKSRSTLEHHLLRYKLDGRKALTGGSWLVTYESMEKLYGPPKTHILEYLGDEYE